MSRSNFKPLPPLEELRRLFNYDSRTGIIRWRINGGGVKAGTEAGTIVNGYRRIKVHESLYAAHRLVWKIHFGEEPPGEVDHIDRNRANNSITNLRISTASHNSANGPIRGVGTLVRKNGRRA
jgi:hypothetical protein